MSKKLFIVCRNDIPLGNQVAQCCHATAEWCKRWQEGSKEWNNETIVIVSIPNLNDLEFLTEKLELKCLDYIIFREPDMNNEVTTIACYTSDNNIFNKLPLILR